MLYRGLNNGIVMWRRQILAARRRRLLSGGNATRHLHHDSSRPIVKLEQASFYQQHPSSEHDTNSNPPMFPGVSYTLPSGKQQNDAANQSWAIVSPSSHARAAFLKALAGHYICIPPNARSYPYLSDLGKVSQHAIQYVGFDAERGGSVGGSNVRGAYLSARYESRREEDDFSLHDYLTGHTELNPLEGDGSSNDNAVLDSVVSQLNLGRLLQMPVANLSNGQTRRARIAKALMGQPEVLLLDGPFMGLDPNTLVTLSSVLESMAVSQRPRLVLSLRPEDAIPEWISHLILVSQELTVRSQGVKTEVLKSRPYHEEMEHVNDDQKVSELCNRKSIDGFMQEDPPLLPGEPLVEMRGVKVTYGETIVLGDWHGKFEDPDSDSQSGLWWSLQRGQRCGIFGPNGSGKTTMLSLITSDHPQTYSLPIKLFGRSRLPGPGEPGISLFDIQRRMGHSSPEVHAFFPRRLTVRRSLESAWADAPLAKPDLTNNATRRVDACLKWFAEELAPSTPTQAAQNLDWAKDLRFAELSFSNQRLILFLRALVASPDLVILDEAFSGMDDTTREKAMSFLSQGNLRTSETDAPAAFEGLSPQQALLVISHAKEDVPGCVREWICLPEPGEGRRPRTGTLRGPLELNPSAWNEIWGEV
ncbi:hypothetical protein MBLNU230_g2240t1 [Neophaeotheca triangularis]